MGFADLHVHTIHSVDGTATTAAVLKYAAHYTDLDVIAITDHDDVRGALEALDLASKYAIDIVPGVEITSRDGHVLALWVEKNIPTGLSLQETLHRIGELGGVAIAAHPMHRSAHGLSEQAIKEALEHPNLAKVLVGIEVFNAGLIIQRSSNHAAQKLARTLPMAQTANSDAHTPWMIGAGRTKFEGFTARDLRSALETGATQPVVARDVPGAAILLDWGWFYAMRLAGMAIDNAAPESNLRISRAAYPLPNFREFFQGNFEAA